MGASLDLGFKDDALAAQLREQEEQKRKRVAMGGTPSTDPSFGASSMLLGLG